MHATAPFLPTLEGTISEKRAAKNLVAAEGRGVVKELLLEMVREGMFADAKQRNQDDRFPK